MRQNMKREWLTVLECLIRLFEVKSHTKSFIDDEEMEWLADEIYDMIFIDAEDSHVVNTSRS